MKIDLISRNAAIEMFQQLAVAEWKKETFEVTLWSNAYFECAEKLREVASVDPADNGMWISEGGIYRCSVCNELWTGWLATIAPIERVYAAMQYCPYCGAHMGGIRKNEKSEPYREEGNG